MHLLLNFYLDNQFQLLYGYPWLLLFLVSSSFFVHVIVSLKSHRLKWLKLYLNIFKHLYIIELEIVNTIKLCAISVNSSFFFCLESYIMFLKCCLFSFYFLQMIAGVAMASLTELSFNWTGFISAMISNISFTYRSLYSKKAMVNLSETLVNSFLLN